jgi:hypothetical protein
MEALIKQPRTRRVQPRPSCLVCKRLSAASTGEAVLYIARLRNSIAKAEIWYFSLRMNLKAFDASLKSLPNLTFNWPYFYRMVPSFVFSGRTWTIVVIYFLFAKPQELRNDSVAMTVDLSVSVYGEFQLTHECNVQSIQWIFCRSKTIEWGDVFDSIYCLRS